MAILDTLLTESSLQTILLVFCVISLNPTKFAKSIILGFCITSMAVMQIARSFYGIDTDVYEKGAIEVFSFGNIIIVAITIYNLKALDKNGYAYKYTTAVKAQHDNNIHPLRNGWNEDGNAEENNGTIDEGGNAEVNDGTIDEGGNAEVNDGTIDEGGNAEVNDDTIGEGGNAEGNNVTIDEDENAEGSNVTIHKDWNAEVNNVTIDEDGNAEGSNVTIDEDGNAEGSNGTIDDDGTAEEVNDKSSPLNFNHLIEHDMEGRHIGRLFVSSKEIAKGSNGTVVFEGLYEGRKVAVKRLVKAHLEVASKEIQNLIVSDQHQHIVRWFVTEYDRDFVYIALERCDCTLHDLIKNSESSQLPTQNGYPSAFLLKLMRDIVVGLVHLHELKVIHRDLKPHNVLIKKGKIICPKLADMGISRLLVGDASSLGPNATVSGTLGWRAPEQIRQERQTRAMDFFSLGCVLFFCITRGRHPFGDEDRDLDSNVTKNRRVNFSLVEHIPEAVNLLTRLLNRNPEHRPKALEVLCHPLFWNPETRMSFLRDASDRVELENENTVSIILIALKQKCGVAAIQEKKCGVAFTGKWDVGMDPAFLSRMKHYRKYDNLKVQDLLRLIRNTVSHYGELPPSIQNLLGAMPEGVNNHFRIKFPKLLMKVYTVMHKHCKQEEWFRKYLET